ncbi:hypothetical protein LQ318_09810 [Aliifodinibius salicampi]|uniref:Uncharacterized protein n=1 Tax=Fodinibius salicampi TaxID=1920655 RepID=A0ABT3PZB7_9BACT|nr:hypothetical protein [Fodinibius salicampi]MCW9713200.1 hypothetical protein [Fodinibius salicampi]
MAIKEADILANTETLNESSLRELYYWLQYEKHTWMLGGGIVWFPYGLIMLGLSVLAVLFTPFMLWQLFRAKWYKSIIVFLAVVILPFVINQFIPLESSVFGFLLSVLPLLNFYIYTWLLSYMVGEYLSKFDFFKRFDLEQKIKDKNLGKEHS